VSGRFGGPEYRDYSPVCHVTWSLYAVVTRREGQRLICHSHTFVYAIRQHDTARVSHPSIRPVYRAVRTDRIMDCRAPQLYRCPCNAAGQVERTGRMASSASGLYTCETRRGHGLCEHDTLLQQRVNSSVNCQIPRRPKRIQ